MVKSIVEKKAKRCGIGSKWSAARQQAAVGGGRP
jgi:hypothetical protein